MNAARRILLLLFTPLLALGFTDVAPAPTEEFSPLDRADPAWQQLATRLGGLPDGRAGFSETRTFRFRSKPVALAGVARVSRQHGLSLEYTRPDPRIVIVDRTGVLFREKGTDRPAPADPRARLMNDAMLHVLRFDLATLAEDFDLRGQQGAGGWRMTLRPRAPAFQRVIAQIDAEGDDAGVRRLLLRRADQQAIDIRIEAPELLPDGFPAAEVGRFFRAAP